MEPILFPHRLLMPAEQDWSVQGSSQEGGRPQVGGTPQRILFGGGGLNVAKFSNIYLRKREQFAAWRAIAMQMDNGAAQIVVPYCNRRSGPILPGTSLAPVPHSDGAFFSDGAGYQGEGVSSVTLAPADFRDTTMKLRILGGRPLIGGEPFSFKHPNAGWRIYWIAAVSSATAVSGGFDYEVRFRTPLRERVAAGTEIEWRLPRCTMRIADPNGMSMNEEMLRRSTVSVAFVEDFQVYATDLGF